MTFLPIHVWIALSFEKETKPLPEQGVISMKSCETEPKLRADRGGSKHGAGPRSPARPAASGAAPPGPASGSWGESWEPSTLAKSQASVFNAKVGVQKLNFKDTSLKKKEKNKTKKNTKPKPKPNNFGLS